MEISNWIGEKIVDLKSNHLFKEYFEGIDLDKIENVYYLYNPEKGIDLVIDSDFCVETIHLFSGNTNDGKLYSGIIPHKLSFVLSQSVIRSTFGVPNRCGGGSIGITGPIPVWDKYYFHNYSLHLQYSSDMENIDLITIASLKLESYLNAGL